MIEVSAPSNIALIKYMGKKSHSENIPSNSSLSITTEHLRTFVNLKENPVDAWQALTIDKSLKLSASGQQRYLDFLKELKSIFSIQENLLVASGNNFLSDAGLASSASSFAALTKAVWEYAKTKNQAFAYKSLGLNLNDDPSKALASLSKKGSGSSCRSFFSPACVWTENDITVYNKIPETLHFVVIIESEKKKISSSLAHKKISSSSLNLNRAERAEKRLEALDQAFTKGNWQEAYEIVWQEFWDMHVLFETSSPPFSFMKADSLRVLRYLQGGWEEKGRGPLVTMDAGPNVHCFYLLEDKDLYLQHKNELAKDYTVVGQI